MKATPLLETFWTVIFFHTIAGEPLNVRQAIQQYGNFSSEDLCEKYVQEWIERVNKPYVKAGNAATVMYYWKVDEPEVPELLTTACIQINLDRGLIDQSYNKH